MPAHEIITRRTLPHWYVPGAAHFVTYRLADTIPAHVIELMKEQCRSRLRGLDGKSGTSWQDRQREHKRFFATLDRFLDQACKRNELALPQVAAVIRSNLHHHHGSKYHLLAYCVMPNHVHVLFQPIDVVCNEENYVALDEVECPDGQSPLARIMHSLKSYTANEANRILGRSGRFWQPESYDHWVRDDDELERIIDYIIYNPVNAGLVARPYEWFFSSAHDRFLQDGSEAGFLGLPVS